jgi:hypothetical protein
MMLRTRGDPGSKAGRQAFKIVHETSERGARMELSGVR